jgi:hypothetical protein
MEKVSIKLPPKRRIIRKEQPPDQRQFTVVPIRAATDRNLTPMQLRCLMVLCSYANRGGITWVGLEKVGKHLGVKINRASVLTRQLIAKGYVRVLYKGYAGERAQTRQIIFNDLSIEDIVAVSGEKPPYMIEKDQKDFTNQSLTDKQKGLIMARKRKTDENSLSRVVDRNLKTETIGNGKLIEIINEAQIVQLQRAVGPDLLAVALEQCGAGATLEQVQTKLKELLA